MSTTIAFTNYSTREVAHPELAGSIPAFASGTPGTKSKVYKQVNADDYDIRFDYLAAFGVTVEEDGVARPGLEVDTAGANFTAAATTQVLVVDTDADGLTVTLQPAATVGAGFKMWIFLRTDGGGDLTVDGDGSETVLGSATQVMADAGDILEIESDGSNWVAHT